MRPVIFDLHSHSTFSDGILSPEQLVSRAKANNVDVLALTDHDTVEGIAPAMRQAHREGLTCIAGVEFSSQWGGRGIHIVGLGIDPKSAHIVDATAAQAVVRQERAGQIADKLRHAGLGDVLESAREIAGAGSIGRVHIARVLVKQGVVNSIDQAFNRYLGNGKPGDVKFRWPEFAEVINWVNHAGGVAVLAHPTKYNMTRTKLCAMVRDFAELGGAGLEVQSGRQSQQTTVDLVKIANKYQLCGSCGSDFHTPGQPWQELGCVGELAAGVRPIWQHWN